LPSFKKNDKPAPKLPPFKDSLKDALNDRILLVTACLAIFSMLTGMIDSWRNGWIEGVCILVALFIQVLITAWNDSAKDTQFVKLQNLSRDEDLPVIRGKAGSVQTLNIWDLVVGDVVLLEAGDKAPADCLFIDAVNSVVDESHFIQDEGSDSVRKERGDMLFADSFLLEGSAKVLVCAVGENSTRNEPEYDTTEKDTPLSVKLEKMGGSIKFFGLIASISILILAMVMLLITVGTIDGSTFAKKFADNLTLAFVILIVVIPEGIPMTIGISLAYSVFDMYEQDHLLIKDLEAPEKLGLINEILVGKTGTMTTEDMKVVSFYI
jgi:P-type Ca2+ transporter type 2C